MCFSKSPQKGSSTARVWPASDLFVAGSKFMDLATLSQLAKVTGGQLNSYPGFSAARQDDVRLRADLESLVTRKTGFEAVMRMRVAIGATIARFYGHFNVRGRDRGSA